MCRSQIRYIVRACAKISAGISAAIRRAALTKVCNISLPGEQIIEFCGVLPLLLHKKDRFPGERSKTYFR